MASAAVKTSGPNDLADQFRRRHESDVESVLAGHHITFEHLGKIVNECFIASMRQEEGRPVKFAIFFNPPSHSILVHLNQVHVSAREFVKLSSLVDAATCSLAIEVNQDGAFITGFAESENPTNNQLHFSPSRVIPVAPLIKLTVMGPGWLRLGVGHYGDVLELRDCDIRAFNTVATVPEVCDLVSHAALKTCETNEALGSSGELEARIVIQEVLCHILERVVQLRHGGTLLVAPNIRSADQVRATYQLSDGILPHAIGQRLLAERADSGRTDLELLPAERNLHHAVHLVAGLSQVDGAVLLEPRLMIVGFGAEILPNKIQSDEAVDVFAPSSDGNWVKKRNETLKDRGMRHRSARSFCENVNNSLALVVSQDGDMRVFANVANGLRMYECVVAERWAWSTGQE